MKSATLITSLASLTLAVVFVPNRVDAKPAYKKQVAAQFSGYVSHSVMTCALCHLTDAQVKAAGDSIDPFDEKPWNSFGLALKDLGEEQRNNAGSRSGIVQRIEKLKNKDTDGDLVTNGLELFAGTWPGDASSKPSREETKAAKRLEERFANRYLWRPFESVTQPDPPKPTNLKWTRNPIDRFIAHEHEQRGLKPSTEAPKQVLLRRVYLDLIGLPPTPVELASFLADESADAYEKVIDDLLNRSQYGERWGRHWMDIWRYADYDKRRLPAGVEMAPHMWRWRDWIITSLNEDLGYDSMLRQMLAADELPLSDDAKLEATGYLARNKARSRDNWLHDTVDHTAQAFVGLSMQCARCHDHPVESITQEEYYQIRAIFEPYSIRTESLVGSADPKKDGISRAIDQNVNAKTYVYIRGNELKPDKTRAIAPGIPRLLQGGKFKVTSIEAERAGKRYRSSGRRLALASWLTEIRHPLTARVAANYIWARHFSRPLVATVTDFGTGGERPTHPALLDWLAVEFMKGGWKMKRLHRLIVTSATYRMHSTPSTSNHQVDPDERFIWRFKPRRMEAELVRDSILHVTGRLDSTSGGLAVDPEQSNRELRRSLYFKSSPYTQMTFLKTFDGADVLECYQRSESIQPKQALALLNSQLSWESARALTRRLTADSSLDAAGFVHRAFISLLSKKPSARELAICLEHLSNQTELLKGHKDAKRDATRDLTNLAKPAADPSLRAKESLIHLLLSHHEFITIR